MKGLNKRLAESRNAKKELGKMREEIKGMFANRSALADNERMSIMEQEIADLYEYLGQMERYLKNAAEHIKRLCSKCGELNKYNAQNFLMEAAAEYPELLLDRLDITKETQH